MELDTPRTKHDFENLRWYLAHRETKIYVDKRKWFLEVHTPCRYLKDHACTIYEKRPVICREHETKDCEYWHDEFHHDHYFHALEELDAYLAKRFSRKKKVTPKK